VPRPCPSEQTAAARSPGAFTVVFEQDTIDVEAAKGRFCGRLVAPFGHPVTSIVSPAHMQTERHAFPFLVVDKGVIQRHVRFDHLLSTARVA
jgi:hypothetical protein